MDKVKIEKEFNEVADSAERLLEDFKANVVERIRPDLDELKQQLPIVAIQAANQATTDLEARLHTELEGISRQTLIDLEVNLSPRIEELGKQIAEQATADLEGRLEPRISELAQRLPLVVHEAQQATTTLEERLAPRIDALAENLPVLANTNLRSVVEF